MGMPIYYPEFSIKEMNHLDFLEAMDTRGCCLIRGAIPTGHIEAALERVKAAYAVRDEEYKQGTLPEELKNRMYFSGHIPPSDFGDEKTKGPEWLLNQSILQSKKLLGFLTAFHRSNSFSFILNNCQVRRHLNESGPNRLVPFHQDASFLRSEFRIINCWFPLVPSGKDAPGLELVAYPIREIFTPPKAGSPSADAYEQLELDEETIRQRYDGKFFWHPEMQPGDAMVFDNFTLHRTYYREGMNKDRYSMEIRSTRTSPSLRKQGYVTAELNFAPQNALAAA